MTNPGNYPPPVFDYPPQAPVLKPSSFLCDSSETSKFQATRDWNWFDSPGSFPPPQPPGPWNCYGHVNNWHAGSWHQNFGPNRHQGSYHKAGGQHYGRQDFGGKKKNKKDPEFVFFCDTCDRGFKNQEKYDEHLSQHVKCSVADCNFMAHEKLVRIHWRNNHAPGTKRIKLDTPEEIAKWRAERRRNYPTLANVEKKMRIMDAKEERGEVLETAQFGRMKGRGRGRGGHRRGGFRGRGRGRDNHARFSYKGVAEEIAEEHHQPVSKPPKEEDPLGALANSDPDSEKEEEVVGGHTNPVSIAPKNMSAGLASLVASYGSMTESESDQEPEAAPILKTSKVLEQNKAMLKSLPAPSQPRAPFQDCSVPMEKGLAGNHPRGKGRRRGRGGRHHNDTPQQRRHTLLEMLLAPDIRHERNVILQCVRYIVRNGFFGLEGKGEAGDGTPKKPQSGNFINGDMQPLQAAMSQSPLKDQPPNKHAIPEHRPSASNTRDPVKGHTDNGSVEKEGKVFLGEECHISKHFTYKASKEMYEDIVWEMDELSSTGGETHPAEAGHSGLREGEGPAVGLNEEEMEQEKESEVSLTGAGGSQVFGSEGSAAAFHSSSDQSKDLVSAQDISLGSEPAALEKNLEMDTQPMSSVYDDDIWEMPSIKTDDM